MLCYGLHENNEIPKIVLWAIFLETPVLGTIILLANYKKKNMRKVFEIIVFLVCCL